MNAKDLMKILEDNAYIRTSGTEEELRCANYIRNCLSGMGLEATLQPFDVPMHRILKAELTVDGISVPCTGYFGAGNWDVEAPIYYLRNDDDLSLQGCRDKIVLLDSVVPYWKYQPPAGIAGAAGTSSLISATRLSVVRTIEATEAAFWRALLVTFLGSTIPEGIISQ